MSSVELVKVINDLREDGKAELRHSDFMVKLEKHPGIDSPKFSGQYKDSTGRSLKCYHLPKRECELMVMSESLAVQAKVYDRMTELEARMAAPRAATLNREAEAFKLLPLAIRAARALGLDKNVASISANQAVFKITGTNVLQLMDHTHLKAEDQTPYLTPTELGKLIGVNPRALNVMLAGAGLQGNTSGRWMPTAQAEGLYRVLDTGKRHGDGTMVQQIKWSPQVLAILQPVANAMAC